MMFWYYLISVVEQLHWLSVIVAACAFTAMTASKIAQGEPQSKYGGEPPPDNAQKRESFRKTCMRYVAIFGMIAALTPPLSRWLEAKAGVMELQK